jgi:hypothetical protein
MIVDAKEGVGLMKSLEIGPIKYCFGERFK